MREIDYRAWDNVQDIMLPVEQINFRERYISLNEGDGSVTDTFEMFDLMQFTGLRDFNNTKIYEGDIVQIPEDYEIYGMMAGEVYEIYFAFGGFRLKPKRNKNAKGNWLEEGEDVRVIGNIYENLELLK